MDLIGQKIFHAEFYDGEIIKQDESKLYVKFKDEKRRRNIFVSLVFPDNNYLIKFRFIDKKISDAINKGIFSEEQFKAYQEWYKFPKKNCEDLNCTELKTSDDFLKYLAYCIIQSPHTKFTEKSISKILKAKGVNLKLIRKFINPTHLKQLCNVIFLHSKYLYYFDGKYSIVRFNEMLKLKDTKIKYHNIKTAPEIIRTQDTEHSFSDFHLYVYESLISTSCKNHQKHNGESITIETKNIKGEKVSFNAFYCKICNKYYTNIEAIQREFIEKPYPIIKCVFDINLGDKLREFSELTLYGYNARSTGLKDEEREKLLSTLVYNDLVSKERVVGMLQWLIKFNGKNPNCHEAVKKWEKDLIYIQNFNLENQRKIIAENVSTNTGMIL